MTKVNTILLGPTGVGKTTSLKTAAACTDLLVLATEPGIDNILKHSGHCHWAYVPPAVEDWNTLSSNAKKIGDFSVDQLLKMAWPRGGDYRQFEEVLRRCQNFRCDVCNESFGPVDKLPADWMFAIDGLTGLSKMSMDLVVGGKPIASQPEWGLAMGNLERFIGRCCADIPCNFTLISHIEREIDEVTGGTRLMVSTLGRRLAPKLPRMFDEVVLCRRQGDKFYWSTTENGVDLKARRLPFSDTIAPDFAQLLGAHPND